MVSPVIGVRVSADSGVGLLGQKAEVTVIDLTSSSSGRTGSDTCASQLDDSESREDESGSGGEVHDWDT